MLYVQSIERTTKDAIGREGVSMEALSDTLRKAQDALARLRARHADGSLPLLRLVSETADIEALAPVAARLQGATDIVFLGTGGSSLGGQAIAQLADHAVPGLSRFRHGPRVHFLDNLDPLTFEALLDRLPMVTTRFVAISKSGGTGETLMQAIAVIGALKAQGLAGLIPEVMVGLSEPAIAGRRNGLRTLLERHGVAMLDHDPGVGGRFSGLGNVGLLPAVALGLDARAIRAGAREVLAPVLAGASPVEVPPALGAALNVAIADERDKSIAVTLAYADRLERFTRWWVQLWAESLGKKGKGTTPVAALGPVDQHSQLQLWLAGPRDKLFTVITTGVAGRGPRIDSALAELAGEPAFGGHAIGDLVAAQGRATADTLAKNGLPVRTLHLERLDERALGALMMHFMLETIVAADLLGVDAFDQPAVEEGKILAKTYLAEG